MNPIMFQILAEPNRLNIVELLCKNPRSVNEIVDSLKLKQPQVSKHLKVLADAGVVEVYPQKNKRVYSLKPKPFKELDGWLTKYRKIWEDRFARLDTLLRKEQIKNKGGFARRSPPPLKLWRAKEGEEKWEKISS